MELPEKLPNTNDRESTGEVRCRAKLSNGDPCLQTQNPADADRCLGGHYWRANTEGGKSVQRMLEEEQAHILPARDRHLRDLGWEPPESAPLHVIDFCHELGALPLAMRHTRGKNRSEYTTLLEKYQRLLRWLPKFRKQNTNDFADSLSAMSVRELATFAKSLEEQALSLEATIDEQEAARQEVTQRLDNQSAVPENETAPDLAPLPTRTTSNPRTSVPNSSYSPVWGRKTLPDH
jgi:hypothetical protein